MNYGVCCKLCHQPLKVEADDGYLGLGDPYKLFNKATCNRCYDLWAEGRRLRRQIERVIVNLSMAGPTSKERQTCRALLETLTRQYAQLIARWHHSEGMVWDAAVVAQLLENPLRWRQTLSRLWQMFQQWQQEHQPG